VLSFVDNHNKRQPVQPPSEWTNFTIPIPVNAVAVQLTSIGSIGKRIDVAQRVPYYKVDGRFLDVSVIWWGDSWKLYIGWQIKS
jgi:hypothetical protein